MTTLPKPCHCEEFEKLVKAFRTTKQAPAQPKVAIAAGSEKLGHCFSNDEASPYTTEGCHNPALPLSHFKS